MPLNMPLQKEITLPPMRLALIFSLKWTTSHMQSTTRAMATSISLSELNDSEFKKGCQTISFRYHPKRVNSTIHSMMNADTATSHALSTITLPRLSLKGTLLLSAIMPQRTSSPIRRTTRLVR